MSWQDGDHFELAESDEVSHVVGSSGQHNNWKKYWCDHTDRKWPKSCKIQGCGNSAEVGAHMYVKGKHQTFIIPACQTCNTDRIHDYPNWVSVNNGTVAVRVKQHDGIYDNDGNRRR